jgi:transposase-like protein
MSRLDTIQRRNHGAEFKARVALAAVDGDKTVAEFAEQCGLHSSQINPSRATYEAARAWTSSMRCWSFVSARARCCVVIRRSTASTMSFIDAFMSSIAG